MGYKGRKASGESLRTSSCMSRYNSQTPSRLTDETSKSQYIDGKKGHSFQKIKHADCLMLVPFMIQEHIYPVAAVGQAVQQDGIHMRCWGVMASIHMVQDRCEKEDSRI